MRGYLSGTPTDVELYTDLITIAKCPTLPVEWKKFSHNGVNGLLTTHCSDALAEFHQLQKGRYEEESPTFETEVSEFE